MKTLASIDGIQAELQRRIDESTWADSYCAICLAPVPIRIEDDGVANWTAHAASTARRGCEGFLLDIVSSVRRDYDLPTQPQVEGVGCLAPARGSPSMYDA
jgi:hypothetical protein